ncbi:MAG: ArdC family protein [Pirellulaceae bacterium]
MKSEEAKQLIERGVHELKEALAAGKSDQLRAYLNVMSRFPRYSFNNQLLIFLQAPDATRVLGFHAWRKLGRNVMKDEKGIAIIAPMVSKAKAKEEGESGGQDDPKSSTKVIRGFKVVHVFDVSQTDGKPLPEFARATGDPGDNLEKMESFIRNRGIQLAYEEIPSGADGVSRKGQIVVRPDLDPATTLMVLIHEYAHECLHQANRRHETTKTIRETEAEAVAHVVGQALGLQSLAQSADYIHLYNGDVEVLTASLDHIQKTAAHILDGITSQAEKKEAVA